MDASIFLNIVLVAALFYGVGRWHGNHLATQKFVHAMASAGLFRGVGKSSPQEPTSEVTKH